MLIGAIEAGGTKFVCALGNESGQIQDKIIIPTTDPDTTMNRVENYFKGHSLIGLGVGSFGPICLDNSRSNFGSILNTPKTSWRNYSLLGRLKRDFNIPIYIDTDVNVAALGEYMYGNPEGVKSLLYITVGTGIGAGLIQHGKSLIGKSHPEMGHILIRQREDDHFKGICPYHKNCLEGLASGQAIEKRYAQKGDALANRSDVWELEADYLAQAITNYSFILSPEKIVIGGGVMKQKQLYDIVRSKVNGLVNNYIELDLMDDYIVPPRLNDEQGVKGAISLVLQHNY